MNRWYFRKQWIPKPMAFHVAVIVAGISFAVIAVVVVGISWVFIAVVIVAVIMAAVLAVVMHWVLACFHWGKCGCRWCIIMVNHEYIIIHCGPHFCRCISNGGFIQIGWSRQFLCCHQAELTACLFKVNFPHWK